MTPIQKLEAEYVDWDTLPDWVKCVTADNEGTVFAWETFRSVRELDDRWVGKWKLAG